MVGEPYMSNYTVNIFTIPSYIFCTNMNGITCLWVLTPFKVGMRRTKFHFRSQSNNFSIYFKCGLFVLYVYDEIETYHITVTMLLLVDHILKDALLNLVLLTRILGCLPLELKPEKSLLSEVTLSEPDAILQTLLEPLKLPRSFRLSLNLLESPEAKVEVGEYDLDDPKPPLPLPPLPLKFFLNKKKTIPKFDIKSKKKTIPKGTELGSELDKITD
ncbi:hypothetical protein Anas_11597 [Armadillidium nasatum]|uniref:Uncharacterized protein n=1 Tax=Armadillidium nasatum TaxID=96803 RepID=A0A5N5SN84_9CRUS|nr:hypothetical protein Anas_11597 [Armadillidium nasatum]